MGPYGQSVICICDHSIRVQTERIQFQIGWSKGITSLKEGSTILGLLDGSDITVCTIHPSPILHAVLKRRFRNARDPERPSASCFWEASCRISL